MKNNKVEVLEKINKDSSANFLIEQLSVQQLIDLAIDSSNNGYIGLESRKELISRGKDNIQARIVIKKSCKAAISNLEDIFQTLDKESDKELVKSFKNKFLTSVSILDWLQLEWQKHDLGLKQ